MNHNLVLGDNEEKNIREQILPGKINVEIEIKGNDSSFDYYGVWMARMRKNLIFLQL